MSQKILIVDDDEILNQVLTRVLTQQGYQVERAADAAQALQRVEEGRPQLALLDLCLPDQDGTELAEKIRERAPDLPLILMTAYPVRLREQPQRINTFARVLTKPLNLQELRQAVEAALTGKPQPPPPAPVPSTFAAVATPASPVPTVQEMAPASAEHSEESEADAKYVREAQEQPRRRSWLLLAGKLLVLALALAGAGVLGVYYYSQRTQTAEGPPEAEKLQAELVKDWPDTLRVPKDVVAHLGVQTATAEPARQPQPLELAGSLALDPNHLVRVHSRFAGEVVEFGNTTGGGGEFATVPRPLRFGDKVAKGQLMAVVWSKDLGEKKSELVDALGQARVDREAMERLESLWKEGATSEASVRNARRAYETDLNAVARAERTLRVWRVTEEEIQEVHDEAERILKRGGKRDAAEERNWARVEVRAPFAGTVVEKNISLGDIVDTGTDLFKVANLDELAVWVNAYEEDLPALLALPREQRRWTVRVTADPNIAPMSGAIDKIGSLVDPNQHTVLVAGHIDNPSEELRAGQFITATVELPPPANVVAVPIGALVENGEQSIAFLQVPPPADADKDYAYYRLQQVLVVQRRHDLAYIRFLWPQWLLLSAGSPPGTPLNLAAGTLCEVPALRADERIVSSGAMILKAALDDLQSSK